MDSVTHTKIGKVMNIGWTVGEEILFKPENEFGKVQRSDMCKAVSESCVLGIQKKNLLIIKKTLYEKGFGEEFNKLEIILRGNYLVKKDWR